jgi:oligopeptide transport system ATP-binding protein
VVRPTAGEVRFDGIELTPLNDDELRPLRRRMQMVFQDPFSSLNPRMTVGQTVAEPMTVHGLARTAEESREKTVELFRIVGLDPEMLDRFPHEFSGGQRQRIGIARSLAARPDFIVCDEPVSALDVSIQAIIVNLFEALRDRLGLTYVFIAHDLAVVRHLSDRIAVMYLGQIVEIAPKLNLYASPLHPYTQALLSAVPVPDRNVTAHRAARRGAKSTQSAAWMPAAPALRESIRRLRRRRAVAAGDRRGALGGVSSPLTERSVRSRAMIYIRSVRRRSLPIASAGAGLISTAF